MSFLIILGHPWIQSEVLKKVKSIEDIVASQPRQVVLLDNLQQSYGLAQHAQKNYIPFGVYSTTAKEAVLANALGAKYIVCTIKEAESFQKIANNYLFDARILVPISHESEIDTLVYLGIDGIVFTQSIL